MPSSAPTTSCSTTTALLTLTALSSLWAPSATLQRKLSITLNANGEKVGLVKVRLYRPFPAEKLIAAIPETAKKIAVLDRTKEPGSQGEPLYMDVVTALADAGITDKVVNRRPLRSGFQGYAPVPPYLLYTRSWLRQSQKKMFTLGINDDVTYLSLEEKPAPNTAAEGTTECKFWGLGGDGTVGANKNSIKIIGDHTDKFVQAYFQYDSKKTGGVNRFASAFWRQADPFSLLHQQG